MVTLCNLQGLPTAVQSSCPLHGSTSDAQLGAGTGPDQAQPACRGSAGPWAGKAESFPKNSPGPGLAL